MTLDYKIDLQLFAGEEKTEKATPKKRREARKKGQVLQSREVNSAFVLIATFLGLKIFGGYMLEKMIEFCRFVFTEYVQSDTTFTVKGLNNLFLNMFFATGKTVLPISAIAFIIGIGVSYVQVGFLFTTETLKPDIKKLNPIEGFKRIISKKALIELLKSVIKVFVAGYVVYIYGLKEIQNTFKLMDMNIESIVNYIANISFQVAMRVGAVLLVIAIIDYIYQWWEHEKNLKMSKQEVKEEHKQTEGDPQIKSKIKEKQRQIAMRRMMQDVPKADVIITNPTHYAIAIKYDKDKYDAPYVLAKGKDKVAEKIKEIGEEEDIPIVENKPVAQMLYKMVDIGDVIPEELYQAVAEILAYVYSLRS
ncbi:flagellar biosynthesis protein FlhB [Thermohalobacter berrensis]|uniref:Flagellar biosynthetic protein FlhB n=1 Tax=Thermohalobacter berrensis TaxID=99594 RepID=A0A419TAF5_9FIRM|nr:flagellar biosynthesis protein FlhB [Thermohalobacter berrensis]RKD34451.1 flagellar biosynthesis protein FlhB [Thermohalobacter berrensis]